MVDNVFDVQEEGDFGNNIPSLKEIALIHIRKISGICCNEFTKGYWEERPLKVGGGIAVMRKYNPDQRAVFCNAVDFLLWLVYPMADKDFKDKFKEDKDDDTNKEEKLDWEKRIEDRKETFKEINLMFARCNFFDSQSGQTE